MSKAPRYPTLRNAEQTQTPRFKKTMKGFESEYAQERKRADGKKTSIKLNT
jgi:hypothetical protein